MSPDQYQDLLNVAVRSYNVPPQNTPRDEMWERINRARKETPRRLHIAPVTAAGGSFSGGRRRPPFRRFWFAASATAMAAGIAAVVALRFGPDGPSPSPSSGGDASSQSGAAQLVESSVGWRNVQLPAAAGFVFTGAAQAGNAGTNSWGSYGLIDDPALDPAFEAFKRAAIAHLKRSEALITSFRTLDTEVATARQTRATVRELLSNTRLLISSPIAARTNYKLVFQDLELILMKMSIVSAETLDMDREQIEQALKSRNLLTRMRDLIPVATSANAN